MNYLETTECKCCNNFYYSQIFCRCPTCNCKPKTYEESYEESIHQMVVEFVEELKAQGYLK